MSRIFLSHRSSDEAFAERLRERLVESGFRSFFLDFHPEDGIPPGRDWEQEIYRQLRRCEAVIIVCSKASMTSKWCFAEATHAKALGKPLFPVMIEPCEIDPVLTTTQYVDMTAGLDHLDLLVRGLKEAGIDPARSFTLLEGRPPYPGLEPFEHEDAAVFFGREAEIRDCLAALRHLQQFGGYRTLVVLGASGSGKSSLIRAGVVPRLRAAPARWSIVGPFRPHREPPGALVLRPGAAAGARGSQPTTVVVIDQLEEILARARSAPSGPRAAAAAEEARRRAQRFISRLASAVAPRDGSAMVVCTLRSDYLGHFQGLAAQAGLEFETLTVGPMSSEQLSDVIEGPARLAGVDVEGKLTTALTQDVMEARDDALPLLAFALGELWERFHAQGELNLEQYKSLGRLSGALASVAELLLPDSAPDKLLVAIQRAFRAMTRIDDEGRYRRRGVRWSDLPPSARPVLERFRAKRLLSSYVGDDGEPMVEVAHEALFRSWSRLKDWLDEDEEFHLWRKRLGEAMAEWERRGKDVSALLGGLALTEAERWLEQRSDELEDEERGFIGLSQSNAAKEGRWKILRRAGAVLLLVAIAAIPVLVRLASARSDRARLAMADQLLREGQRRARDGEFQAAAEGVEEARHIYRDLGQEPIPVELHRWDVERESPPFFASTGESADALIYARLSGDGERLWAVRKSGIFESWRLPELTRDRYWQPEGREPLQTALVTDDGGLAYVGAEAGSISVWDLEKERLVHRIRSAHTGPVWDLAHSATRDLLISAGDDGSVLLWGASDGTRLGGLVDPELGADSAHAGSAEALIFVDEPGGLLASGGEDGVVKLWPLETRRPAERMVSDDAVGIVSIAVAAAGRALLVGDLEGGLALWRRQGDAFVLVRRVVGHSQPVMQLATSNDAERVISAGWDGTAIVWELPDLRRSAVFAGHRGPVLDVSSNSASPAAVTAGADGSLRLWQPENTMGERRLAAHAGPVLAVDFTADGHSLHSAARDGLTIRDVATLATLAEHRPAQRLTAAAVTDGGWSFVFATQHSRGTDLSIWRPVDDTVETLGSLSHAATVIAVTGSGEIAVGDIVGNLSLWSLAERRQLWRVQAHESKVLGVAISATGEALYSVGEEGVIARHDRDSGAVSERLAFGGNVTQLRFVDRLGQLFASGFPVAVGARSRGMSERPVRAWRGGRLDSEFGIVPIVRGVISFDLALNDDYLVFITEGSRGQLEVWRRCCPEAQAFSTTVKGDTWNLAATDGSPLRIALGTSQGELVILDPAREVRPRWVAGGGEAPAPDPDERALLYAELGLWSWARELLAARGEPPADVRPEVLLAEARAHLAAGDVASARAVFARRPALLRGSVYGELMRAPERSDGESSGG